MKLLIVLFAAIWLGTHKNGAYQFDGNAFRFRASNG